MSYLCIVIKTLVLCLRIPLLSRPTPLPLVWRLPALPIGLSVPSVLPPSVGGSFWTPSLPPLWCLGGGGSRRSFGCAAPLGRLGWAGVAVVFGGPLVVALGGCCGRWPLCCSSSFGLGWLLFCSARMPCLLGLLCRRCPLWVAAALLVSSVALRGGGAKSEIRLGSGIGSRFRSPAGFELVFFMRVESNMPTGFCGGEK